MSRLTAIPSRLSAPKPRVGAATGDKRGQDRQRDQEKPWRAWYRTSRWSYLRREVLKDAEGVCEQTGVALVGGRNAPRSAVVDHIKEHKGDPELFWDRTNLQAVSKKWHDNEKQKQERADRDT